jgi:hypothetical protein
MLPGQTLRPAYAGVNGNPSRVFGKRHLDAVPHSCAFRGKEAGTDRKKGSAGPTQESGSGHGNPENKNNDKRPQWWPYKAYRILDAVAYCAVDMAYEWLNNVAEKLGKKNPISKELAALGAVALGFASNLVPLTTNENGMREWAFSPGRAVSCAAFFGIFVKILKWRDSLGKKQSLDETEAAAKALFCVGALRLPAMAVSLGYALKSAFSANAIGDIQTSALFLGIGIYAYLISGKKEIWKKVDDVLREVAKKEYPHLK